MNALSASWQKRKKVPPTNPSSPSGWLSMANEEEQGFYELVDMNDLDTSQEPVSSTVQAVIGEIVVLERKTQHLEPEVMPEVLVGEVMPEVLEGEVIDADADLDAGLYAVRKIWEMEETQAHHMAVIQLMGEEQLRLVKVCEATQDSLRMEATLRAQIEEELQQERAAADELSRRIANAERRSLEAEERARLAQEALDSMENAMVKSERIANRLIESNLRIETLLDQEQELQAQAGERLREIDEQLSEMMPSDSVGQEAVEPAAIEAAPDSQPSAVMPADLDAQLEEKYGQLRQMQIELQTTEDMLARKQKELTELANRVSASRTESLIRRTFLNRSYAVVTCYIIGIILLTTFIAFLIEAALRHSPSF